ENLAIHLEKGGSKWFGLAHHLTDRALNQTRLDRALDSHKIAQLPPRTEATRFLRKPYIQLSTRQRKCPAIEFHPTPRPERVLLTKPGPPPAVTRRHESGNQTLLCYWCPTRSVRSFGKVSGGTRETCR